MRRRLTGALAASTLILTTLTATAVTASAAEVDAANLPTGSAAAQRVAGDNRAATAAAAAAKAFPGGARSALIARSDSFPDALAAAYLAGTRKVPILLTDQAAIPRATLAAIDELGVTSVTLLGLESAIPANISEAFARNLGEENVTRLGGQDRFETASTIALAGSDQVGQAPNLTDSTGPDLRTAIVALGTNFPDALSAGPLSYANQHPILLVGTDTLPSITRFTLEDTGLNIKQVIITGGTVAVSKAVEDQIRDLDNLTSVVRVAGDTRTATAVEMGLVTRDALDWPADTVALATGRNFPDALTLAPLAAATQSTLFLSDATDRLGFDTFRGIQALCNAVDTVLVAGGPVAVADSSIQQARLATACADAAFPLSGDQEVPTAGAPAAAGFGYLYADDVLCLAYGVTGIEGPVTQAHIHGAIAGIAGPVETPAATPDDRGFGIGCVSPDDAGGADDLAALTADIAAFPAGYYLNLHTATHPAGAARGQFVAPDALHVTMRGDLEVTVDDDGAFTGFAPEPAAGAGELLLFDGPEGNGLCWSIDVTGLTSSTAPAVAGGLHLHTGAIDQNGPIVAPLGVGPVGRTDFLYAGCMPAEAARLIEVDGLYANLHTEDAPSGALRGQTDGLATLIFGNAEVDTTTPDDPQFGTVGKTDLVGAARLHLGTPATDASNRNVCIEVRWPNGAPDAQTIGHETKTGGIHVHQGRVDQNGSVQIEWDGLDGQESGITCVEMEISIIDDVLADLPGHYLNVHTTDFAGGIARGQLAADVSGAMDGMQEVDGDGVVSGDLAAAGVGGAFAASDVNPDVVCGYVQTFGLDGFVAAHVHDGDVGSNGPVVVPISDGAAADQVVTADFGCATSLDEAEASSVIAAPEGFYLNVHTADLPAGAVRGQLADTTR